MLLTANAAHHIKISQLLSAAAAAAAAAAAVASYEAFHLHSLDLKQLQLEKWQNRFKKKTQHSTKRFWQGRLSSCFHNI